MIKNVNCFRGRTLAIVPHKKETKNRRKIKRDSPPVQAANYKLYSQLTLLAIILIIALSKSFIPSMDNTPRFLMVSSASLPIMPS